MEKREGENNGENQRSGEDNKQGGKRRKTGKRGRGAGGENKENKKVLERDEREKRKKNCRFKGVKEEAGDIEKEIRRICKEVGSKILLLIPPGRDRDRGDEEDKNRKGREGELVIVKVKSEEIRRRILGGSYGLKKIRRLERER